MQNADIDNGQCGNDNAECRNGTEIMRRIFATIISICIIIGVAGCVYIDAPDSNGVKTSASPDDSAQSVNPVDTGSDLVTANAPENHGEDWRIRVVDTAGEELWSFTESGLVSIRQENSVIPQKIISTVNNWPAARFYVAEGYGISSILQAADVYETIQSMTIRAADGYEVSLTRDQLFSNQYYYPNVNENDENAVPVEPMIAYHWREGTNDINAIREDKPVFIVGQRTPYEHTNPAFVVGVAEIVVDFDACEHWQAADTFPQPGPVEPGETVKLQHPCYGLVKIFYTLDGSEPSMFSALYNPSTYQTELNKPIPITEPTTIKVLVTGYGRNDSEIAVFEFWPEE